MWVTMDFIRMSKLQDLTGIEDLLCRAGRRVTELQSIPARAFLRM